MAWLPRLETTSKPKLRSAASTSLEESRLRRGGMCERLLVSNDEAWLAGETQALVVFSIEVQRDSFGEVRHHLVQGPSLSYDCNFQALGYERPLAPRDRGVDRVAERRRSRIEGVFFGDARRWSSSISLPIRRRNHISAAPNPSEVVPFVRVVLRSIDAAPTDDVGSDGTRIDVWKGSDDLYGRKAPVASFAANPQRGAEHLFVDRHPSNDTLDNNVCQLDYTLRVRPFRE